MFVEHRGEACIDDVEFSGNSMSASSRVASQAGRQGTNGE